MDDMKQRAMKRALEEAMALVDEADVATMRGRRAPPPSGMGEMGEGGEECAECAAGECVKHLSPEDAEGMMALYGEE